MRKRLLPALAVLLAVSAAAARCGEKPAESGRPAILDNRSSWRCFAVRGSELAKKESGELVHLYEFGAKKVVKVDGKRVSRLNVVKAPLYTAFPPKNWTAPDFDDSAWGRRPGTFYAFTRNKYGLRGAYVPVVLVCLRGRFRVDDPAQATGLELSLQFEGGAVVYLNGRELARKHLPAAGAKAGLKPDEPAEAYPKKAYVAPDGYLLRHKYGDIKKYPERYDLRARSITGLKIPRDALRKGVNVLCIELHRAPGHEAMFTGRSKKVHPRPGCWWNRVGLGSVLLSAAQGSSAVPNTGRPAKLVVWNHQVLERSSAAHFGDPNEKLRPVKIQGARNGAFSGKVLVGCGAAIKGPKAEVSDLAGPGKIPAAAIEVRYALPDGSRRSARGVPWFDTLEKFAPETVAADPKYGAVQPVWVTVNVPRSAKPGKYAGKLKISTGGATAKEVPVEIEVADWTLPDSKEFATHAGLIQSPESVALKYGVGLWSEKHWKLLDESFRLLGQVGTKTVYLTMIRRTHFGNQHSMIRWKRGNDGKLTPDFRIAERYIKIAAKHLGKIPVVGIYCWEPPSSSGHFGRYKPKDREIMLSVLGKNGGELEEAPGPKWGTPECQEFWNTAFKKTRAMLAKYGLEKSMMFAMAGDYVPTKSAADQLHKAAPEAKWAVHCHPHRPVIHGVPTGYLACVWGVFGTRDPALPKDYYGNKRYYGWKNPFLITAFPRGGNPIYEISCRSPITHYRFMGEGALVASGRPNAKPPGVRGFGRVGADFWPVLKDKRGRLGYVCGRYPESAWGQLNLSYSTPYVLGPGRDGPAASTRFEMLREGMQLAEARVFIEKALLDPGKKAKLGDELAAGCQQLLDERVRTFMRAAGARGKLNADWTWYFSSDALRASRDLYRAAAEVAGKLGAE